MQARKTRIENFNSETRTDQTVRESLSHAKSIAPAVPIVPTDVSGVMLFLSVRAK